MAISWTTMEQKAGGGAKEERRADPLPPRELTGDPPSTADMLADKSPKMRDCK